MAKKHTRQGFLGLSQPEELCEAIRRRSFETGVPASRLIRPLLEAEFLTPKKLEDKQKTGKLRK
jgi:hypothetical protein